jgi:hypothetical protein
LGRVGELDAWSVQFGDELLLYASNSKWNAVADHAERGGMRLEEHPSDVRKGDMYLVVQKGRLFQQEYPDATILLDKGRYLAVELSDKEVKEIGAREEPCFIVQPLEENTVVFDTLPVSVMRAAAVASVTWVQDLVNNVNITNFQNNLTHLVSYHTRHSTSSHYTTAATWCKNQLDGMGYTTSLETISVGSSTSKNVVAEKLGGGSGTRDLVIVVAHLDSVNSSGGPSASAPGADDNGSGSAGLLEIAGALKNHTSVHDLRFVLFGGEEQGLHGSNQYVSGLSTADKNRVKAVLNMDMIGTQNTTAETVLLEGATLSQSIVNDLVSTAATYATLNTQTSLNPFASDHVPFINAGIPAVLTIEGADSANSNIHTANDTLTHIDYSLAHEILKMNVALVALKIDRLVVKAPLEEPKEFPKEFSKEIQKDWAKDPPKEYPKESIKDFIKDPGKEMPKDPPKEFQKEPPKEFMKEIPKDLHKDSPFDPPGPVVKGFHEPPGPVKGFHEPIGPVKHFMEPPGPGPVKSFMEPPIITPSPILPFTPVTPIGPPLIGPEVPFPGAPFIPGAGMGTARQQVTAAYRQLLSHYYQLYTRGLLDASGLAAWQSATVAYFQLLGS